MKGRVLALGRNTLLSIHFSAYYIRREKLYRREVMSENIVKKTCNNYR
jgi:hypothetical protein